MTVNEFFIERVEHYRAMIKYAEAQIETLERVIE